MYDTADGSSKARACCLKSELEGGLQTMEQDDVGPKQFSSGLLLPFVCNRWSLWNESADVGLLPVVLQSR
jgi:hypothetical protein